MNWLDIIILAIVAVSVLTSLRKGFSREIIGLLAVILALLLGIWFYGIPAGYLAPYLSTQGIANFAGFFLVFCFILALGAVAGALAGRFLKVTGLSFFDHLLGAGFGLIRGTLIALALVTGLMAFSQKNTPPEAIVKSRVAPYVTGAADVVAAIAPHELKEGFRKTYAQVKAAWEEAVQRGDRKQHERKI
jgi:membrane protein required for colicin V production